MADREGAGETITPGKGDFDGDGISDDTEMAIDLDPINPDTDGDGVNDGDEGAQGTDPLVVDNEPPVTAEADPPADEPASEPTNQEKFVENVEGLEFALEEKDATALAWVLESMGQSPDEAAKTAADLLQPTVQGATGTARLAELLGIDSEKITERFNDTLNELGKALASGDPAKIAAVAPGLPTGNSPTDVLARQRTAELFGLDVEVPGLQDALQQALTTQPRAMEMLGYSSPTAPGMLDSSAMSVTTAVPTSPTSPSGAPTSGSSPNAGDLLGGFSPSSDLFGTTSTGSSPATGSTGGGSTLPAGSSPGGVVNLDDTIIDNSYNNQPGPYDDWSSQSTSTYGDGSQSITSEYTDDEGNKTYVRKDYDPNGNEVASQEVDENGQPKGSQEDSTAGATNSDDQTTPGTDTSDDTDDDTDTGTPIDDDDTAVAYTSADDTGDELRTLEDALTTQVIKQSSVVNPSRDPSTDGEGSTDTIPDRQGGFTDPIFEPAAELGTVTANLFNKAGPEFGEGGPESTDTAGGGFNDPNEGLGIDTPRAGGGSGGTGDGGAPTSGGGGTEGDVAVATFGGPSSLTDVSFDVDESSLLGEEALAPIQTGFVSEDVEGEG